MESCQSDQDIGLSTYSGYPLSALRAGLAGTSRGPDGIISSHTDIVIPVQLDCIIHFITPSLGWLLLICNTIITFYH